VRTGGGGAADALSRVEATSGAVDAHALLSLCHGNDGEVRMDTLDTVDSGGATRRAGRRPFKRTVHATDCSAARHAQQQGARWAPFVVAAGEARV